MSVANATSEPVDSTVAVRAGSWSRPHDAARTPGRGAAFGRYRIERVLGEGGMGTVLAAVDPQLDRLVALKILRTGRAADVSGAAGPSERRSHSTDPTEHARLLREARAMAQITHPNVIAVFDVGTHDGQPFIAMELVEGVTLRRWLQDERTFEEIVRVFVDAGRGLAAAHGVGLIHRDFKPSNVLVGDDGRVRVLDFGLVRAGDPVASSERSESGTGRSSTAGDLTEAGLVMGTPKYMSPEQHLAASVDERSDQFSFCVALFEALYGTPPFAAQSAGDLGRAKLDGDVQRPSGARSVPAWVWGVVARGLAARRGDRWPDMGALLVALDPGRRATRRRFALAAVPCVGALVAWMVSGAAEASPCSAADPALRSAWAPQRKADIQAALRATGIGFADSSWHRIERSVDRFVDEWNTVRAELCRADDGDGTTLDLGMACLGRGRAQVLETLDLLRAADVGVATSAVALVDQIDDPRRCLEPDLDGGISGPTHPDSRRCVEIVRTLVEQARARSRAGRAQAALEVASRAWKAALDCEDPRVRLESRLARGRALSELGRFDEAKDELATTHWAAVEAGMDALALESALHCAHLVGVLQSRTAEGLDWARHAQAALERTGVEPDARLRLLEIVASLLRQEGKLDAAQTEIDAALALVRSNGLADEPVAVPVWTTAGTIAADAGRHAIALEHYERSLAIQAELLGDDHPELATQLDGIGRVRYFLDDPEGALSTFERSLALREAAWGSDHPAVATSLNNVGGILRLLQRPREARDRYERALRIRERVFGSDSSAVAIVLLNLSAAQLDLGDARTAIESSERALAVFEKAHGEDHPDVCMVLNNLGMLLDSQGRYDEALERHRRALAIRERILPDPHPDRALSMTNIARAHLHRGEPGAALDFAQAALRDHDRLSGPEHSDAAYAAYLTGWALEDLGRSDEAVALLERAVDVYDREQNRMFDTRPRAMFQLARALSSTGAPWRRACALVREVRDTFEAWNESYEPERREVARWLHAHPQCR
jgi:eukaryotic-like serine/threonine-protein kinase